MTNPLPASSPFRLDELIDAITKTHSGALDRLSNAVLLADHLGELSDHLIGHFVDQARRSGASWAEIGRSMGVSKQAAQKRFVPKVSNATELDMQQGFNAFTESARRVVVGATKSAHAAGNAEILPGHLLLALLAETEGLGWRALAAQGLSVDAVRAAASAVLPDRSPDMPALIPFDSGAKKVLELSYREALRLGHGWVGTEHVVLGLLEHEHGEGTLSGLGASKAAAEEFILANVTAA